MSSGNGISNRGRRIGLCTCAALALATLPAGMFPIEWLAALLLPAAIVVLLRRAPLNDLELGALGLVLQSGALFVAVRYAGPLDRLAALGASLLPPLVFLVLRAEPLDVMRGLFLAFCVLLIGTILGEPSTLVVLAFLAVAAATLQADVAASAAEDRASARTGRAPWASRVPAAAGVVTACLLACIVTFHAIGAIPAPTAGRPAWREPTPSARSAIGLSSDFEFGNAPGAWLSLRADALVQVASADGRAVPADLYLRCAHFDTAGLDRWGTRRTRMSVLQPDERGHRRIGPRLPLPIRTMRIELLDPQTPFAFVPPGAFRITGAPMLLGDQLAAAFRFPIPPRQAIAYDVAFHPIHSDRVGELPDERLAGLTEIGSSLRPWRALFEEILSRPRVRREVEPMQVAAAIAAELHAQCSYAMREPKGPHAHSILNFLDGEREGFCMHFASVTAICLRLAGIPARIAVGLFGGDRSEDEPGVRVYGSRHAHAWVEVPFAGLGWIVFDPTPAAARENLRDFVQASAPEAGAGGGPAPVVVDSPRFALGSLADVWQWIVALAAAILLLGVRWRRSERVTSGPIPVTGDARSARKLLQRLLAQLAAEGHPRLPGETIERYVARLRARGIGGAAPTIGEDGSTAVRMLADAFAAYQEIRFGGRPFDAVRRQRLTGGR